MKEVEYILTLILLIIALGCIIVMSSHIQDLENDINKLDKRLLILETKYEVRGF